MFPRSNKIQFETEHVLLCNQTITVFLSTHDRKMSAINFKWHPIKHQKSIKCNMRFASLHTEKLLKLPCIFAEYILCYQ